MVLEATTSVITALYNNSTPATIAHEWCVVSTYLGDRIEESRWRVQYTAEEERMETLDALQMTNGEGQDRHQCENRYHHHPRAATTTHINTHTHTNTHQSNEEDCNRNNPTIMINQPCNQLIQPLV